METLYLKIEEGPFGHQFVYYKSNDMLLGRVHPDDDGCYYFVPKQSGGGEGYWSSHILEELSNLLKELNKPYEEHLQRYFEGLEEKSGYIKNEVYE